MLKIKKDHKVLELLGSVLFVMAGVLVLLLALIVL